jgi:hypothetical protein
MPVQEQVSTMEKLSGVGLLMWQAMQQGHPPEKDV